MQQKSYDRLQLMKEKTEASSYAEVLKNALRLYEAIIDQYDAGRRLYLKDKDGTLVEYKVL
ncbi:hypothetical protein P3T25_009654 [Paraburkholderia sp. GAS32]